VQVRAEWICFYDAQQPLVVRFVMLNGASLADAEDAAQEAFTESWDLMSRDPGLWQKITHKEAWIRTVALRRYWRPPGPRRRPLTVAGEVPDLPASGPGPEELTAQTQLVLRELQSLDEEARAVMAFDLDDFPPAVIAEMLHISQQRVRDLRKKARAILKKKFGGSES
jgi:RNA polymerase sigma factor (sigma-70 family)